MRQVHERTAVQVDHVVDLVESHVLEGAELPKTGGVDEQADLERLVAGSALFELLFHQGRGVSSGQVEREHSCGRLKRFRERDKALLAARDEPNLPVVSRRVGELRVLAAHAARRAGHDGNLHLTLRSLLTFGYACTTAGMPSGCFARYYDTFEQI